MRGLSYVPLLGNFPVVLVNRHLRAKRTSTYALYPMAAAQAAAHRERLTLVAAAAAAGGNNSSSSSHARAVATLSAASKDEDRKFVVRDEDVVSAARRQRDAANPRSWSVQQVNHWLEDALSSSSSSSSSSGSGDTVTASREVQKTRREAKEGDALDSPPPRRDTYRALDGSNGGWVHALCSQFMKHKVDGTVLLQLEDADLEHTFGVSHRLHRRKVLNAVDDLRNQEFETRLAASGGACDGVAGPSAGPGMLDEFIAALDGDRIRLVSRLKVAFDRVDTSGTGTVSVFDAKAAFEVLGRRSHASLTSSSGDLRFNDVAEAWLMEAEARGDLLSFPDFAQAYSKLFAAEDPDARLADANKSNLTGAAGGGSEAEIGHGNNLAIGHESNGHVTLRRTEQRAGNEKALPPTDAEVYGPPKERHNHNNDDDDNYVKEERTPFMAAIAGGGARSRREGEGKEGGEAGRDDGSKAEEKDGEGHASGPVAVDQMSLATASLQSVARLAQVKEVFDRFAVEGLLTSQELIQALTELGTAMPRSVIVTYLKGQKLYTPARRINFFQYMHALASTCFVQPEARPRADPWRCLRATQQDDDYHPRGYVQPRQPYADVGLRDGRYDPPEAEAPPRRRPSSQYTEPRSRSRSRRRRNDYSDSESSEDSEEERRRRRRRKRLDKDRERDSGRRRSDRRRSRSRSPEDRRQSESKAEPARASFRVDDKVEGLYKGKGSKWYSGTITRTNNDGTFDVRYDDGDVDIGARAEHLRPLPVAQSQRGGGGSSGDALREGMKVEARYRGKSRYYTGVIKRENRDGTFDIDYDDGEKEMFVAEELIRSLESTNSKVDIRLGDKVEALYKGKGTKWFKGKVSRVNSDGTFDIDYDDGDHDFGALASNVRSLEEARGNQVSGSSSIRLGDKVEALYKGKGTKWFTGKVSRVNSDGTFDIDYDDGDRDFGALASNVRSLESPRNSNDVPILREGSKVEARYRGKTRYYTGVIKRENRDGTFDIDYDDGEKEMLVGPELIRSLEPAVSSPSRIGGGMGGSGALREGMKVEARYRGKSRYYTGVIKRENRDGTFDIDYDDGEKEMFVDASLIRSLDVGTKPSSMAMSSSVSRSKFRVGQSIEARYRGKNKLYPGKITRDNGDGTYDIDYDDGEKEFQVREDYIESAGPPSALSPVRSSSVSRPTTPSAVATRIRPSAMNTRGLDSVGAGVRRRAGTP